MATYRLVTGPATEPLTYSEVKAFLRLNDDSEQALVTSFITAARQVIETRIYRPLITQTWDMYFDYSELVTAYNPNNVYRINKAPLQSVDSVKYYDSSGVLQTMSASNYEVDLYGNPARIRFKTLPTLNPQLNVLYVTFTAGYLGASNVPEPIKEAMRFLIGHMYENRQEVVTGTQVNEIPKASEWLLEPYRNNLLAANNIA